jgi:hypothetical protein
MMLLNHSFLSRCAISFIPRRAPPSSEYTESLIKVRSILGSYDAVGVACGGLSGKAVMKWRDKGRPPRTEYTGETQYAKAMSLATQGKVKAEDLIPSINQDDSNAA